MTPSKGPPSIPNMLKDICKTVVPAYSHKNESPIVIMPKMIALIYLTVNFMIKNKQISKIN